MLPINSAKRLVAAADPRRFEALGDPDPDPDATSIYNLGRAPVPCSVSSAERRLLIYEIRQDVAGLRAAIAAGWDVGPELEHEQRRLAELEETC
jgi:hypothetical protein